MAESKKNVVVHGLSGKLGDLIVFRQRAGKTLATQAPGERQAPPTAKQQAVRDRFQKAVLYGKSVMTDEKLKEEYKNAAPEGTTGYNVAIADFFNAPDITEIDVSGYTGQIGQPIKIVANDDFRVKAVKLSIRNDDGTLVEEGDAIQTADGPEWIYTSTAANGLAYWALLYFKIVLTARSSRLMARSS